MFGRADKRRNNLPNFKPILAMLASMLLVWMLAFGGSAAARSFKNVQMMPSMQPGTTVKVLLKDLVTVVGIAEVSDDAELALQGVFDSYHEVRLLITNAETGEIDIRMGYIDPLSQDLLVKIPNLGTVSFKDWLREERNVSLVLPAMAASR